MPRTRRAKRRRTRSLDEDFEDYSESERLDSEDYSESAHEQIDEVQEVEESEEEEEEEQEQEAGPVEQIRHAFQLMDRDGKGYINVEDLVRAAENILMELDVGSAVFMLRIADLKGDKDGRVGVDDLVAILS